MRYVVWDSAAFAQQVTDPTVRYLFKVGVRVQNRAKQNAPVDTGRLRRSITTTIVGQGESAEVYVGTNVEYAGRVEYGTSRMTARHYLHNALNDVLSTL